MTRHYDATDDAWHYLTASLEMYQQYIQEVAEHSAGSPGYDHFAAEAERIAALRDFVERDDVTVTFSLSGGPAPQQDLATAQDPLRHPQSSQEYWKAQQAAQQAQNASLSQSSSTGLG